MKKSRSLELAGASSNRWWLITLSGDPEVMGKKVFSPNSHSNRISKYLNTTLVCFIYILDSSNSSSFTFWTSHFTSSSRCNWTGISTGNSNDSWTDKHSSHFSTAKEMSVKATFFFMWKTTILKWCWNVVEILLN